MNKEPQIHPVLFQPQIDYQLTYESWESIAEVVRTIVLTRGCRSICDVGGGARPILPLEFIKKHNIDYVLLDISAEELSKAPKGYRTRLQDMTKPLVGEENVYDFVFSRMLAEHIENPSAFHANAYRLLRPGGVAYHFFPTLFAPPFVLNILIPHRIGYFLLNLIQPWRKRSGTHGKFPAFYRWCRGPVRSQFVKLESVGFKFISYTGFYGHAGYYQRLPLIRHCHWAIAKWLCAHPLPWLTSYSSILLMKPVETDRST